MFVSRGSHPRAVLALVVACALSACAAGGGDTRRASDELDGRRAVSAAAYHDAWRKLFEDHVTWTRIVIMGVLDALPGTPDYTARLLQNYEDMESALTPYYDADDVEALGDLLRDHLAIAAAILTSVHDGDAEAVTANIAAWRTNADQITTQMAEMNPEGWPEDEGRTMWQEHLDATLAEATAHASGDFQAEIAAYDEIHFLALDMADFFSGGVMAQQPRRFRERGCVANQR